MWRSLFTEAKFCVLSSRFVVTVMAVISFDQTCGRDLEESEEASAKQVLMKLSQAAGQTLACVPSRAPQ